MKKNIQKITIILSLVILVTTPLMAAGQNVDLNEQCCKVRTDLIWKHGKIGSDDCVSTNGTVHDACKLKRGQTVGPTGAICSLAGLNSTAGTTVEKQTSDWAIICTIATVNTVTNWIFFLMMTLTVILIVIGGAIYMTSGGDPAKAGKGKTIITYAIIGLVIALVARFIPAIVKFILGVS